MLTSSDWQLISIVAAVVIPLVIYLAQRQRKELAFSEFSRAPILSLQGALSGKVKINFDNNEVTNVEFFTFGLKNSGNVPIKPEDYEKQFSINFGESSKVLSVSTQQESPANINLQIVTSEHGVSMVPALLNPNDYIVFNVLVSNPGTKNITNIRAAGIEKLTKLELKEHYPSVEYLSKIIIGIVVTAIMIVAEGINSISKNQSFFEGMLTNQDSVLFLSMIFVFFMYIFLHYFFHLITNRMNRFIPKNT